VTVPAFSSPAPAALDGRQLGRRGTETRQRLLDATAALLETHGVRDLRVVDVARAVGTSPATFYQYFRDVEEAVLALAAGVGNEMVELADIVAQPWQGSDGLDRSRDVVSRFISFWDEHRAVLRTRNLAAQEGDPRFRNVRNEFLRPLMESVELKVRESQAGGKVDGSMTPYAAAAALVAMLERMAAFHADLEGYGVSRDDLVETTARILFQTVTGQRA
jgi:AcrR family transcriptional regulator